MAQSATDTAAAAALVLRQDAGAVARLVLNRPEARNALSSALMAALQHELDALRDEPQVKVVVLAASGPAFSAGHDLKEMRAAPERSACSRLFAQCSELMLSIVRLPQPVIAQVQGVATAAGCQLVATCDLAVAARSAWFATPGVNIGLFCTTPAVALARAVARKPAMEMLLTGERVTAERAAEIGLVNRVVDDGELEAEVAALAAHIASRSRAVVVRGKAAFYRQLELDLAAAYAHASEVMTENLLAAEAQEGIDAFLEKRPAKWRD